MTTKPVIKAITQKRFDRAFEGFGTTKENARTTVRSKAKSKTRPKKVHKGGAFGTGKSHAFRKFVEQHAQSLEEVEAEGAEMPVLLVIDPAVGSGGLLLALLRSFEAREQLGELTEVLTPPHEVPSQDAVEQARRNAQARAQFLDEFPSLTSNEVADLMGSRSRNRAALANSWRQQGRVFSVQTGRDQLYPLFQLDADVGRPKPLIADVLKPLREAGFDGWQIALWFSGALSQLEDRRPIDMLDEAPDRVVAAARSVGEVPY